MEEKLRQVYYDVANPAGYSSVQNLYEAVKSDLPKITKTDVKEWLSRQRPYTLLKPVRHNFQRNRVLVSAINEEFQADLLDVSNLSGSNKNFKFILTVIDVLSKYAFAIPLKNKTAVAVRDAFKIIFSDRVPFMIHTDDGKEFKGAVKTLFDEHNIMHVIANDTKIKCSVAERFNKTLRLKIARYLRHTGKKTYIDVLNDIVKAYNHTVHSSIKMRPVDVNISNQDEALHNLYGGKTYRQMLVEAYNKKADLAIGDFVRLKILKTMFGRGYQDQWSTQLYRISEILKVGQKPMFRVVDAQSRQTSKKFYKEDLQRVVPNTYNVTLTNRKRTRAGAVELEVIYEGSNTPCWIPETSAFNG